MLNFSELYYGDYNKTTRLLCYWHVNLPSPVKSKEISLYPFLPYLMITKSCQSFYYIMFAKMSIAMCIYPRRLIFGFTTALFIPHKYFIITMLMMKALVSNFLPLI